MSLRCLWVLDKLFLDVIWADMECTMHDARCTIHKKNERKKPSFLFCIQYHNESDTINLFQSKQPFH